MGSDFFNEDLFLGDEIVIAQHCECTKHHSVVCFFFFFLVVCFKNG